MAGQTTNYLFDYPTSTDYVKDGATAIQTLATDVDTTLFTALGGTYAGLRFVKSQAIGSAVSSIVVNSAFSATYDDYLIKIVGGNASTDLTLNLTLNGIVGGYYTSLIYNTFSSGTPQGATNSNTGSWAWAGGGASASVYAEINLRNPFVTTAKTGTNNYIQPTNPGQQGSTRFFSFSTTSATGFTITTSAGTITGGTVYVYGYGKS